MRGPEGSPQQAAPLLGQAGVPLSILCLLSSIQELPPQLVPHARCRAVLLSHLSFQGGFHHLKLSACKCSCRQQSLVSRCCAGHSLLQAQPGRNLGTTWAQPGHNLGTSWAEPGHNLGTTWAEPRHNLDAALEFVCFCCCGTF